MTPVIYIDFKNPASYLAMQPTCEMLERFGITARWLPFSTSEDTVPGRKAEETRGEQHRRVRAIARRQAHLLYAGIQGVEMAFRDDPGSTETCLAALSLLDEGALPFIHAAFESYWVRADNLDDEAVVRELWDRTVPDLELDLERGRETLAAIREDALEKKVFHAPTYILGDQVFLGREHLPWIETLL